MLTQEQREKRRHFLGASDVPNLVGLGYQGKSAADLYLEKTADIEDLQVRDYGPIHMGVLFEPVALALYEHKRGLVLERDVWTEAEDIFCANLDGFHSADYLPVEAKSSGLEEDWGKEEFSDEVPDRVLVQTHMQMWCISVTFGVTCKTAEVAVIVPAYRHIDHRIYVVERDDDLMEQLLTVGRRFWNEHVIPRRPPDDIPKLETLKRVKRGLESATVLDDDVAALWDRYDRAGKASRNVIAFRETLQAKILSRLCTPSAWACECGFRLPTTKIAIQGEPARTAMVVVAPLCPLDQQPLTLVPGEQAEVGLLPDGGSLTYREQNGQRRTDYDLFLARDPGLYKECVIQGRHRVLRHKAGTKIKRRK